MHKLYHFVKPWYFLIIALIAGPISIQALRANNEQMIKYRTAVYTADKDNGNTDVALRNLQRYVTAHMNTNLSTGVDAVYPPIQLKYTYERLVAAQNQQVAAATAAIYPAAQAYCEQQDPTDFSGHNRVPCIDQYVQDHGVKQPAAIPDSLYKFSFISPSWSPDTAGWSLLIAVTSAVAFVVTAVGRWCYRRFIS